MRFLSIAYMEARFPNHMPKQGGGYNVFSPSNGSFGSGSQLASAGAVDVRHLEGAINAVETWFLRQISIFSKADPSLLPLDLKEALADMVFDRLFNIDGKTKDDSRKASKAESLILGIAPSYDGAVLDDDTGEIVLSEDACLLSVGSRWS